jgi:hypothetical protein
MEQRRIKTLKTWVAAAALLAMTNTAQATLINLGNGTVKDDTTNLIWLQDWNVNGNDIWSTQKAWAEGLDFAGSTDWRLPEISEYAALFTEYGDLTQVADFTNVQPDKNFDNYWSGTSPTVGSAWYFNPVDGFQYDDFRSLPYFAVAVRPGDVAAVPEPQTLALALMALGAMVVARRRRRF